MPPKLPVPEGDRCNLLTAHQEVVKEAGQSALQCLSVLPMWLFPSPGSSSCESTRPSTRNLKDLPDQEIADCPRVLNPWTSL
ncbi:hypothetical protein ATANTOWER_004725 [Ataeniobius toweri]|uniref:Uncharacterized protein n=1 Tax=Ataeniobius toweri TaxID=208326 RepID=A0ABU7AD89_9TELE|nr:hypothetical protein [Ataeniobius toweri]